MNNQGAHMLYHVTFLLYSTLPIACLIKFVFTTLITLQYCSDHFETEEDSNDVIGTYLCFWVQYSTVL